MLCSTLCVLYASVVSVVAVWLTTCCVLTVAYVQAHPGSKLEEHTGAEGVLKVHVAPKLPAYMVPKYIVFVDEWPLNTSNKVMRQQLPMPPPRVSTAVDGRGLLPVCELGAPGASPSRAALLNQVILCVERVSGNNATADTSMLNIGIDSGQSV